MGMSVTRYVTPERVGYAVRDRSGYIALCRSLETAKAMQTSGIVRLCVADHCSFGESPKAVVRFSPRDISFAALSSALATVEYDEEGYPAGGGDEPVDYDGKG